MRYALILLFILLGTPQIQAQQRPPTQVTATKVLEIPLCVELEALGNTLANESVLITATTSAKVTKILFDDGQVVKEGDTLVELDKEQEEAQLKSLEAQLIEKKPSFERAKVLVNRKATAVSTLETREASLKEVEAEIEGIKAKINDCIIQAPFSGVLGFRAVSLGTLVRPGDLITTLYDVSQIKVDFEVPSLYLSDLAIGQEIKGRVDAYPHEIFKGKISAISPQVDAATRTVRVRAILANKDTLLKPGLFITILVKTKQRDALVVPEESIKQRGEEHFVYKLKKEDGDKTYAILQKVDIGIRKPGLVEIVKGVTKGDSIIERGTLPIDGKELVQIITSSIYKPVDLSKFKCETDQ